MAKQTFHTKLIELLKSNPGYLDEAGGLLRARLIDHAYKLNNNLIGLLLTDNEIAEEFFDEIDGRWIFNHNTFVRYVKSKNFLPGSYTQFQSKIRLNIDDKSLDERGEVALVWPYKDCVLEGGQTKEEENRKEVFFNELIAQDEINRMLHPKVLTNWKRHTATGEQQVKEIQRDEDGTIRENLIIKGNNLIALHSLREKFGGKVKLIYIDPPFNTGGSADSFTYNNNFKHSTWLTFMKNRLEVAEELLKTDGFIAIAIDHHELFYLGALADDIFGRENRLAVVSVVHQARGRNMDKGFSVSNEFMLVYAKTAGNNIKNVVIDEEKKKEFNLSDEKGNYNLKNYIMVQGGARGSTREDKPESWYPIYVSKDLSKVSLEKVDDYEEVLPISNTGRELTWITKPETFLERFQNDEVVIKREAQTDKIVIYRKFREQQIITTHWIAPKYNATSHGTILVEKILGRTCVSYPKSLHIVLDIMKLTTDEDDIILDFFAGSGTTGHAVLELNKQDGGNRQFILVEQLETQVADCKERLENVIAKDELLADFLSCELMRYNETFMDRIQSAKSSEDLLEIWSDMSNESFLNWYVKPEMPAEAKDHFISINDVEEQRRCLADLLDKNQLYVHLSEIEDEKFEVSEADKLLNKKIYDGGNDV